MNQLKFFQKIEYLFCRFKWRIGEIAIVSWGDEKKYYVKILNIYHRDVENGIYMMVHFVKDSRPTSSIEILSGQLEKIPKKEQHVSEVVEG